MLRLFVDSEVRIREGASARLRVAGLRGMGRSETQVVAKAAREAINLQTRVSRTFLAGLFRRIVRRRRVGSSVESAVREALLLSLSCRPEVRLLF